MIRPMAKLKTWTALATLLAVTACGYVPGTTGSAPEEGFTASQTASRWWAVQFHSHSSVAEGKNTIAELIAMAKKEKLDALAVSEHDTLDHFEVPEWKNERELTMIHSYEWTSKTGHMGLHGAQLASMASTIPNTLPNVEMIAQAEQQGLTKIIHHPKMPASNYWKSGWDSRINAIEVWSNWYFVANADSDSRAQAAFSDANDRESMFFNSQAIKWWDSLLRSGYRIPLAASSDYHRWPQKLSSPCTLVLAKDKKEESLLAALRAGRTVGVKGPGSARIVLEADRDGDGQFESIVGDSFAARTDVALRATVVNGRNMTLSLHTSQGQLVETKVPENRWSKVFTLSPGHRYAWARLDSKITDMVLQSITSPIYVDGR